MTFMTMASLMGPSWEREAEVIKWRRVEREGGGGKLMSKTDCNQAAAAARPTSRGDSAVVPGAISMRSECSTTQSRLLRPSQRRSRPETLGREEAAGRQKGEDCATFFNQRSASLPLSPAASLAAAPRRLNPSDGEAA